MWKLQRYLLHLRRLLLRAHKGLWTGDGWKAYLLLLLLPCTIALKLLLWLLWLNDMLCNSLAVRATVCGTGSSAVGAA